jgi:hypothetical protein
MISKEITRRIRDFAQIGSKDDKVRAFEDIIIILKDNKFLLEHDYISKVINHKIDEFSEEYEHLKSFKYQLF